MTSRRHAAAFSRIQGGRNLRTVLTELDRETSDSPFEFRVRRKLAKDRRLPTRRTLRPCRCDCGAAAWSVDVGWSVRQVGKKCQSRAHHSGQRERDLDDRKRHELEEVGWTIRDLSWRRYTRDWDGFVVELLWALRGHRGGFGAESGPLYLR